MAKYDSNLTELKNLLPTAKKILIALPASSDSDIDRLAAGLALFLSLTSQGKEVYVVCEETTTVGQAYLFGIDHIQKNLPRVGGGNMTLIFEGVAASDNTVPALENLDWYAENNNLNLVFHVVPGQTFQPARIVPHYQGSGFGLIFVIGSVSPNSLGSLYAQNAQIFSGAHLVNIDNQQANTGFGQTNVLDSNASSVSEIMEEVINGLGLSLDADTASNLISGVFATTDNLTNAKVSADTFMIIANLLRAGGKKPQVTGQPAGSGLDLSGLMLQTPVSQPVVQAEPQTFQPAVETFMAPPIVSVEPPTSYRQPQPEPQASPEERPAGERVVSESPEPDWLRPKVYSGKSIG